MSSTFFHFSINFFMINSNSIKKPVMLPFKRLSETSFAAFIYDSGERVAECSVYYGEGTFGSPGIAYSHSSDVQRNSFNESLSVVDNGYNLQLKPLGVQIFDNRREETLSQQGAAEYYWGMFIKPLQE